MADFFDCLQTAMDGGVMNRTRGQLAQAMFDELKTNYRRRMPDAAAAASAAADVKTALAKQATSRRHTVLAQLQAARKVTTLIEGADRPDLVLKSLIEFGEGRGHDFENVRAIRDGLQRQFNGMIGSFLRANGKRLTGALRNPALLKDIVRELHGEASGSAQAKLMAAAIDTAIERARTLFNAHGGDIGKLEGFGLPHSHDAVKIRKAGFDAWRAEIEPRLDWARIIDRATDKPFADAAGVVDPAAAARMLREIYDNVTTGGWNKRQPAQTAVGKALMNRRADHRVLHFKGADDWFAYNEAFGGSNPFDAMVSHLQGMARDIALMRVMGPNPNAVMDLAIQTAERKATLSGDPRVIRQVGRNAKTARAMLGNVTGSANQPADAFMASFLAGTRNILTAAQLGAAALSSVTDVWTMNMAARSIGMNPNGLHSKAVKLMASQATRETAAQMGYVADTLADAGSTAARFLGEVWSPEVTERLANFVIRASGLGYWTDMNRIAWQMEFAGLMATNAGRSLGQVDKPLRDLLVSRGITPGEWAKLSDPAHLFTAPNGSKFLALQHWLEATNLPRAEAEGLSARLQAIVEEQMEFAVPSVSIEGRVAFTGETAPGTFQGELGRSVGMYKNFSVSLTINQYRRTMAQPTGWSRAKYAASFVAGMWLFGSVGVQLKEIAKGRDPRPMDTAKFWGAAFLQGGGIGIVGDFFASETSRVGGGFAETLGGPVVGLVGDLTRAVSSNVKRVAEGRSPLLGRDVSNLTRRYTPGSSLWYGRLATERLIWDQMQDLLDPEARQQWRRQEKRARRENGTQSWWRRGQLAPDRAPDLGNVITEGVR